MAVERSVVMKCLLGYGVLVLGREAQSCVVLGRVVQSWVGLCEVR